MPFLICEVDQDVKDSIDLIIADNPHHSRNAIISQLLCQGIIRLGRNEDRDGVDGEDTDELGSVEEFEVEDRISRR